MFGLFAVYSLLLPSLSIKFRYLFLMQFFLLQYQVSYDKQCQVVTVHHFFRGVFSPSYLHYSNFVLFIFFSLHFQVSWLRHVDTHLLTTGLYTYTQDRRFTAIHRENSEDWVLEIRDTSIHDQGKNLNFLQITLPFYLSGLC